MPVSFLLGIAGDLPDSLSWVVSLIRLVSYYRFPNVFVRTELRILDYEMWIQKRRKFFVNIISLLIPCIILINTVLAKSLKWRSTKSILSEIDLYSTSYSLSDSRFTYHLMLTHLIRHLHHPREHQFEAG